MKVSAIIVAAGTGSRMGSDTKKQFLLLSNKPILAHTLTNFEQNEIIDEIVLVCGDGDIPFCRKLVQAYQITKAAKIVVGGQDRQASVRLGLEQVESDFVLVHDGVRPFLTGGLIERLVERLQLQDAVVPAVPVKDTIKVVGENGEIVSTPPRKSLWAIQTPQAFRLSVIKKAHELAEQHNFQGTDDASLVENLGRSVYIIEGDYENIKITTPEDLSIAEALLRKRGTI